MATGSDNEFQELILTPKAECMQHCLRQCANCLFQLDICTTYMTISLTEKSVQKVTAQNSQF